MKAFKERMQKMDKICSNIQETTKLFKRKKNNSCILSEQDINIVNQGVGCIISKSQMKKQQSQQRFLIECETVRSIEPPAQLVQEEKIIEKQEIKLIQQQKQKKKEFITQDKSLLPQMYKLQQEKAHLEQEINQIDQRIGKVRFGGLEKIQQRNWKEEKKNFEQKWSDLESYEPIECQQFPDLFEDVDQQTIDVLTKEVEDLLCLKIEDQQEYKGKISYYQSPLQTIDEEYSIDQSEEPSLL